MCVDWSTDDCEYCRDLPEPTSSYLPLSDPGEPLVIYAGPLQRRLDDRDVSAPGQVTLTWKQLTHLEWSVDPDWSADEPGWEAWRHRLDQAPIRIMAQLTEALRVDIEAQFRSDGNGWIDGQVVGDPDAPLNHVVAHWINLPSLLPAAGLHEHDGEGWRTWTGRWIISLGEWVVTIDARPDHGEVYRRAVEDESFVITHVMDLRRADGANFTGANADEVLSCLHYAMSFAVGHWTCPAVPIGYGLSGELVWSKWAPLRADRPRRGAGWWDPTQSHDLRTFLAAYHNHWSEPNTREPLRFATTAAILAVETGFVEQRIQTAYSAIEMLSWITEVLEAGMAEREWRRKGSAWRVRRLLSRANVDISLDRSGESRLSEFARVNRRAGDAPDALAKVRDRLTHPRFPTELYEMKGLVMEAWLLACHYLELVILHRIGYHGQIADRTKPDRWIGESDPTPWASR